MTIDIYVSTDYIQVPIIKQSKMYLKGALRLVHGKILVAYLKNHI